MQLISNSILSLAEKNMFTQFLFTIEVPSYFKMTTGKTEIKVNHPIQRTAYRELVYESKENL